MPLPRVKLPISSHALPNGLRLLISESHELPIAATAVCYEVGSVDEDPGRTGFAHLFEHLMFQGSANVPRNAHFQMVQAAGGTLNAFTSKERTVYFEAVPSHHWKLPLWLEADRMRSLAITEENFQTERSTVKEERRLRYDNQAYGTAHEVLDLLAQDDPAYAHSVIGSMDDLDRAALADVQSFWERHYSPNNATLVVAGDVREADVIATAREYFGSIGSRREPRVRPARAMDAVRQERSRTATLDDPHAKAPAIYECFPCPELGTRAWYATQILMSVLTHGESSRLYRRLVKDDGSAIDVHGSIDRTRGPGTALFLALVRGDVAVCRSAMEEELEKIRHAEISEVELEKGRNRIATSTIHHLASTGNRAVQIAVLRSLTGRDDAVNSEVERYFEVTTSDVLAAARGVLAPAGRASLTVMPRQAS
ncbi:MAG: pitrilysin family protein [Acidobacteriota bacterium]